MPKTATGTPRTAGCDEVRQFHIKTRLTGKEVEMLDLHAASLGVSRSAAIRSILLNTVSQKCA